MDGLQVTIFREVFGVSFVIGAPGVWKAVNVFLDAISLLRVAVECEGDEFRELHVERFGISRVLLIQIRCDGVDHLKVHPIVDRDL